MKYLQPLQPLQHPLLKPLFIGVVTVVGVVTKKNKRK